MSKSHRVAERNEVAPNCFNVKLVVVSCFWLYFFRRLFCRRFFFRLYRLFRLFCFFAYGRFGRFGLWCFCFCRWCGWNIRFVGFNWFLALCRSSFRLVTFRCRLKRCFLRFCCFFRLNFYGRIRFIGSFRITHRRRTVGYIRAFQNIGFFSITSAH